MQGTNPSMPGDSLTWLSEKELFHILRSKPSAEHMQAIYQLRDVHRIDVQTAKHIQDELPYMIGCRCNPMSYREENYVWSDHLCLEVPLPILSDPDEYRIWRNKMQSYPGVTMAFLTATGDRLMLIFNLRKPCRDRELFRLFYRLFANAFFDNNKINYIPTHNETDPAKSICLSYDPDTYYCFGVKPINIDDYINQRNIDELKAEQRLQQKRNARREKSNRPKTAPPTDNAIDNIRQILGMPATSKRRAANKTMNTLLNEVDNNMEILNNILKQAKAELVEVQILKGGRKLYVQTMSGITILNVMTDKDCHLAVTCTHGGDAKAQEQQEMRVLVTNFMHNLCL